MSQTARTVCLPVTELTVEQTVHATLETVLELKDKQDVLAEQLARATAHVERNNRVLRRMTAELTAND